VRCQLLPDGTGQSWLGVLRRRWPVALSHVEGRSLSVGEEGVLVIPPLRRGGRNPGKEFGGAARPYPEGASMPACPPVCE